jgi:hypoxanthine phosphoribosyltransferase
MYESKLSRNVLFINDEFRFNNEDFVVPSHYVDTIDHILIPSGLIHDRIEKLAIDIVRDHSGTPLHFVCILKGGAIFYHDLIGQIRKILSNAPNPIKFTLDYVRVKSYEGTESTGNVQINGGDLDEMRGKHVILVEDIVDTGTTMSKLIPELAQYGPLSVKVATLLEKRTARNTSNFLADYACFSIPDRCVYHFSDPSFPLYNFFHRFVIGYGMDYNEVYRDLGPICVINDHGIQKFASTSP